MPIPETPIPRIHVQQQRPKRRRGCGYFIGIFLVIFAVGFVLILVGRGLPSMSGFPGLGSSIAIVPVTSVIMSPDQIVADIQDFAQDDNVKGIVVRIDSPGGAVGASQEIYSAIMAVRRQGKPVYASMGNTAASGGYYVAAATDRIFANPGTVTGSIGVIIETYNWEQLAEKVGLEFSVVKSGEFKDIGSRNRPMTEDDRLIMQGLIDDVHQQFVEAIIDGRQEKLEDAMGRLSVSDSSTWDRDEPVPMSVERYMHILADGRLYSGRQAHDLGLVDDLGSLDDALYTMAQELGMGDNPKIVKPHRKATLADLLGATLSGIAPLPSRGASVRLMYRVSIP